MLLKEKCSCMSKANKFIGGIIREYKDGDDVDNVYIKEVIEYHPMKNIKVDDMEWLKIKIRPPYNTLSLFYKYKNIPEDDISWKLCIRNYYGKYKPLQLKIQDIHTAFRNEAYFGNLEIYRKKYLYADDAKCSECSKDIESKCSKLVVDHYPTPFKKIYDSFIEEKNIELIKTIVYENFDNMIRLKDNILTKEWLKYHDNKAEFRLLCKSCNSHFGSYGYK